MNSEWKDRLEVAVEAAHAAGQAALRYFGDDIVFEWKEDKSPVTVADRQAEQILRSRIHERFPGDGFLGEEFGEQPSTSGFRWIMDPIDGTRGFIRGIPMWATLVGLEYRGETIAGVVDAPVLKDRYRALRGDGAYRNDRPIRVSNVTELQDAALFYSSLAWFLKAGREDSFANLVRATQRQRGYGDFYGFVLVAQGSGDLMVEYGVQSWDVAAVKPIVEEAGGRFSDWDGNPTIYRADALASNGKLHEASLRLLQAYAGAK